MKLDKTKMGGIIRLAILLRKREWRNWKTRTFKGRVGNRTGSTPVSGTRQEPGAKSRSGPFLLPKIRARVPADLN